jgi:ABC-2 type transport system ATP-binding protein
MAGTRLQTEGITKKYGAAAVLNGVAMSLASGEVLGLFGPNGSGKSTLLDILALALRPDGGRILIDGADALADPGAYRSRIGYAPQDVALFEELTVRENLLCWSRLPGKDAREKAGEVAARLSLEPILKKRVSSLSGGMKRRVNLAVCLMGAPKLLILDEPFTGVDMENADKMTALLKELAGDGIAQVISGMTRTCCCRFWTASAS